MSFSHCTKITCLHVFQSLNCKFFKERTALYVFLTSSCPHLHTDQSTDTSKNVYFCEINLFITNHGENTLPYICCIFHLFCKFINCYIIYLNLVHSVLIKNISLSLSLQKNDTGLWLQSPISCLCCLNYLKIFSWHRNVLFVNSFSGL